MNKRDKKILKSVRFKEDLEHDNDKYSSKVRPKILTKDNKLYHQEAGKEWYGKKKQSKGR